MTPEILPPALRPQWEQIREALRRPPAEAARSVVFAATDPSLAGRTGLVIDESSAVSDVLTTALTPALVASARTLTERVLATG